MLCKFFFPTPFHNYHSPKLKKKKKERERKRGREEEGREERRKGQEEERKIFPNPNIAMDHWVLKIPGHHIKRQS